MTATPLEEKPMGMPPEIEPLPAPVTPDKFEVLRLEIGKLEIGRNDILVIKMPERNMTMKQMDMISRMVARMGIRRHVYLPDDMELSTISMSDVKS